ncbi:MAG: hypothetical protein LBQ67_04420 [Treponema sp.]|nr:hypothetical protein [Treponema sp.]
MVSVSHKAAFSLLISVFLFAGLTVLAYTGLFDLVEARFYNPSVTRALARETEKDAELIQNFLGDLQNRFFATLREPAVRRSFLPNQSGEDIFERSRIFGLLLESAGGLQSVRFIDAGGSRIHYSTWEPDMLRRDRLSQAYRNYGQGPGDLPYSRVMAGDEDEPRLTLDGEGERLIFSLPFHDSFEVYRGTALFSLSLRAVTERLIGEDRLPVGEALSLVTEPAGFVSRLPASAEEALLPVIALVWRQGTLSLTNLNLTETKTTLSLISSQTSQGFFVGRLADESLFSFSRAMQLLLLASAFSTLYLIVFLLFNLRQDYLTIAQTRIRELRDSIIDEYTRRRDDLDGNRWRRDLEQRREEVRLEIRGMLPKHRGRAEGDIDALLDTSWRELMAVIRNGTEPPAAAYLDEARLQDIVDRVLKAAEGRFAAAAAQNAAKTTVPAAALLEEPEELDEEAELNDTLEDLAVFNEIEAGNEVEAMKETETSGPPQKATIADTEELEELEEIEEPEELEELEMDEPAAAPESTIAALASQIEFSPLPETDDAEQEQESLEELEIVSPFATMLSNFSEEDHQESITDPEDPTDEKENFDRGRREYGPGFSYLEVLDGGGQTSLVYKPFMDGGTGNPPALEIYMPEIIVERNGVSYVNEYILEPDQTPEEPLNRDFKELIDSVLRNN